MDVGVRELKKRLSELLDRAARGEVIRVTVRGEPRAILAPLPGLRRDQGVEEGWIRPGRRERVEPVTRQRSDRRILDVLEEDRGA